jgi:hypothetical protein
MSALHIFEQAPLGALIRFSDGAPRPPARFNRKLSAWESTNGTGRLTAKQPRRLIGSHWMPAGFQLHLGDYGSGGVTLLVVTRHYQISSPLNFEIIEVPQAGMVRVLTAWNDTTELRHLAANMAAAEAWAETHRYSGMRFDVVDVEEANRFDQLRRAA